MATATVGHIHLGHRVFIKHYLALAVAVDVYTAKSVLDHLYDTLTEKKGEDGCVAHNVVTERDVHGGRVLHLSLLILILDLAASVDVRQEERSQLIIRSVNTLLVELQEIMTPIGIAQKRESGVFADTGVHLIGIFLTE